ncbi:hypothetical protein FB45DRAFT_279702 [Roridomyces roridus]|uniref:Zn(2)-C6 fungal-type domain-containing protein n=1 Tax=Roridomyces roridus TaxID=1738132 RepID=A0AAD7CA49_9AGAR|nr:hypothetical protein FB45DRAFT_279702 [Roridomyces roridus]
MHADPAAAFPTLKGEIMDLEFNTIDTDHRKRRRNRTTQSCLNCHTSKRKCDRKRPCQRCIQLGLTGLCVYEIDDPALRDDPTVDENTRLRNRIAELESLVRELRGKPHPRWADTNFRDGDPNEKWHSRATKCAPVSSLPVAKRRNGASPDSLSHHHSHPPALLPPIKTEPLTAGPHPGLYRFSSSPGPHGEQRYSAGGAGYDYALSGSGSDDGAPPYAHSHYSPSAGSSGGGGAERDSRGYCSCRASPAMAHTYIGLTQALQSTLSAARTYTSHPSGTHCVLYRRIVDLASLIGTDPTDPGGPAYDSLSSGGTPTDSEVLTPLSASTGSFHGGSPGSFHSHPAIHAAHAAASSPSNSSSSTTSTGHPANHNNHNGNGNTSSPAFHPQSPGPPGGDGGWGYNAYFPLGGSEHGMYGSHVIS